MADKKRLDLLVLERGLVESREKAKALILAGKILVNGEKVTKASKLVPVDSHLEVLEEPRYVSRGGYKLESAFERFKIDVSGKVACDIGASTGGFTDFLLKNGARKVFAVDVGYGQLHWKLRNDPRVVVMERVNARYLKWQDLGERVDIVTCDVSFISVKKILPAIYDILKDQGDAVILVKPQFEAPRKFVKKGIVKDPEVHVKVLMDVQKSLIENGFVVKGCCFSKIKGADGNIEFFFWVGKEGKSQNVDFQRVVEEAWKFFGEMKS
ncbi:MULTISPECIES: TlyA family RNA methyltransferase [Thermotoga]|uniref:Hemolysin A n=1 Tax=Thermotoga neapolitana (strain ATCC 49049 / DSM 4359 / NBRC 107923 / NS-E) TaxID=309803 RepID=B9K8Q2_THENN|nr:MULTISPECIES: TlyA family RNA methyltransferase [Thermotoga]MDK2785845.1 rRNA (cytidine1920-2-O)/16S rRNA (cytidine1409-2-O)-methyltransferase [Thermotoga sp.]HBF11401.1 TlyA family rRNA (cytidine-2'-O)-methyltransferase [Thermotoga neapolitana]ACM23335.1 Hemolysin A precursor [Thermotoga neapolitana DSM 4359]AJG41250.1 RNA methyltransferase [Thermotoga sp. RQ7]KFZ21602.1 Hemolysin A precursor [Thermotoga neapolitana LA10]